MSSAATPIREAGHATAVVRVERLRQSLGGSIALDEVSFVVPRGSVFAVVGPNGAGKSTLLEILSGLQVAQGGRVEVLGRNPGRDYKRLAPRLGVQLQATAFPPDLKVTEILALYRAFFGGAPDPAPLVEAFALRPCLPRFFRQLSAGQRQKLGLIVALFHGPELLILDEPVNGLDLAGRQSFWRLIGERAGAGTTVVLAGHQLDEIERFANQVAFLDSGRLLDVGTPAELLDRVQPGEVVEFVTSESLAPEALCALPSLSGLHQSQGWYTLYCASARALLPDLLDLARSRAVALRQLQVRGPSLQDAFIALAGKRVA